MHNRKINQWITVLLALFLGLTAGLLSYTQIFLSADQRFTDWVYDHTLSANADDRITIIATGMDGTGGNMPGDDGNENDLSRSDLADAVSLLSQNDAAVIGLDVDLSAEGDDADGNLALADACSAAGNVIAIAKATYAKPDEADSEASTELSGAPALKQPADSETSRNETFNNETFNNETFKGGAFHNDAPGNDAPQNPEDQMNGNQTAPQDMGQSPDQGNTLSVTGISYPYEALRDAVTVGISNATQQSPDGSIRNAALSLTYDDQTFDSFSVAVYKSYQASIGQNYYLPDMGQNAFFGFNNITNGSDCNIIRFSDLLSGNYDPDLITGNIILIGSYDAASSDAGHFAQFVHPNGEQQEVLMQTSIIQTLLNQKMIFDISPLFQALCYALLIALFYLFNNTRRSLHLLLTDLAALLVIVCAGFIANQSGRRFLLLIPVVFLLIALFLSLLQHLVFSILSRREMERTFKLYVDSQVVEEISEKSPEELAQVSRRKHIAVLFVDIRGFTSISESLEPEQVVEILNEYLSSVADAIQKWGGTVDKFIGDAAMAVFNAPRDQEDYIFRAVCAADEILKSSAYIREKYEKRFGKTVSYGIGINCGEAIVGNIGSKSHMDYTAIGDTVNTAARLEAHAGAGQILVSEAVWYAVRDRVRADCIGSLSLKGKSHTVTTYEIQSIIPDTAAPDGKELS